MEGEGGSEGGKGDGGLVFEGIRGEVGVRFWRRKMGRE